MTENLSLNTQNGYLQIEDLKKYNDIVHFFAYKPFDFKTNINQEKIIKQYNRIQNELNYSFKKIISPAQNHTNIVKSITNDNINDTFENVDGLITNLKGIALAIKVADCQSILLYDNTKKVIGNVHSGWKGTLNKIIENAIQIMIKDYNCNPQDIRAYILPSILKCCFEVQEDVKSMFQKNFSNYNFNDFITEKDNSQKYFIDTANINKMIMLENGLLDKNIFISNICTKCNSRFFHSYRYNKENAGRNLSLISIRDI